MVASPFRNFGAGLTMRIGITTGGKVHRMKETMAEMMMETTATTVGMMAAMATGATATGAMIDHGTS
jgi:hypothetical protein